VFLGVGRYERLQRQRREILLATADFTVGSSRHAVLSTLGNPDVELARAELSRMGALPPCTTHAATQLSYIGFSASCTVYLDDHDRVVCVLHGPGDHAVR
jgi:hypothetical protein